MPHFEALLRAGSFFGLRSQDPRSFPRFPLHKQDGYDANGVFCSYSNLSNFKRLILVKTAIYGYEVTRATELPIPISIQLMLPEHHELEQLRTSPQPSPGFFGTQKTNPKGVFRKLGVVEQLFKKPRRNSTAIKSSWNVSAKALKVEKHM